MAEVRTWEKELDHWVVATDGATVLLEFAAADLVASEASNSLAGVKYGSYLGECMVVAILSGVPVGVVRNKVRAMAGMGGVDVRLRADVQVT